MANFASIGKSLVKFDFDKIIKSFFDDKKVQKFIISTIQTRLFNDGLKQNNQKISTDKGNPYTSFTSKIKQSNNQPSNRVTLLSNGDLYKSMIARVKSNQLELVANFDNAKYEGGIFKNFQKSFANKTEFRAEVMSLTPGEIDKLIENLIKGIIQEMKNKI